MWWILGNVSDASCCPQQVPFLSPHSLCNASALFPPVCGQTPDEVGGFQAAAEHRPHRGQQEQFTVISSCIAQGPTNFLHDLKRKKKGDFLLEQTYKISVQCTKISAQCVDFRIFALATMNRLRCFPISASS